MHLTCVMLSEAQGEQSSCFLRHLPGATQVLQGPLSLPTVFVPGFAEERGASSCLQTTEGRKIPIKDKFHRKWRSKCEAAPSGRVSA